MELLLTLGGLFAIANVLYALWSVVYGPDRWVLIQAGILIVVGTVAGILSARKG